MTLSIHLVLHPHHKLSYFRNVEWPDEWITTAETIVRTNYEQKYQPTVEQKDSDNDNDNDAAPSQSSNIFDNLPALVGPSSDEIDEVTRYLQIPPDHTVTDPLAWWYEHRHVYPGLSHMARDYLSVPATSVDVERIFSGGRMLLSYLRNRLQVGSTCALLCLGEWIRKGVVKDRDIMAALKGVPEMCEDGEDNE